MTDHRRSLRPREQVRVLVIDDDELAREFLVDILRSHGFTVSDSASTIGVTNQIIREEIHVVVLDVMMPTIRGDRLATLLRKHAALHSLGVVLVSSHPPAELEQIANEVGAEAVVGKHEARSQLAAAVMRAARVGRPRPSLS
jgi:PleD family two-component response regulator